MKLRFLNAREQGKLVELKTAGLTFGRDPDNDLMLTGEGVSRHHCRITMETGQFFIEDLQSTNGVRRNGQLIAAKTALFKGDHLGIGSYIFQVTEDDEQVNAANLPLPPPLPPGTEEKATPAAPAAPATEKPTTAHAAQSARNTAFPWPLALTIFILLGVLVWVVFHTFFTSLQPPHDDVTVPPVAASAAAAAPGPVRPEAATAEITAAPPEPVKLVQPLPGKELIEEPGETAPSPEGWVNAGTPTAPGSAEVPLIVVSSEPPGATVTLDNKMLGQTPLVVRNLAISRHTLKLSLPGYDDLVRQIHPPAVIPDRPYVLQQRPGTLRVTTIPPGAVIQQGTRILGQAPLLLQNLPEGEHELWAAIPGYDPVRFKATVTPLRPEAVTLTLKSRLGDLEVTTYPAGCIILVDETPVGTSQAATAEKRDSQPFLITGLPEGEHELRIQHPLGAFARARVQVVRDEIRPAILKLWVLDTEVVLTDGTRRYGMLIEKTAIGDIVLAETVKRLERYLKPQIAQILPLTAEKSKTLLQKLRTGELGAP